ncbi:MAG TPA: glycosyltransferase family 2 protein [Clostridiales bacterium]|nr:glycosyltransferase family 2 protein [Clostridiales bacterium]HQK73304.1 glycosyltransferase family 2 protein [Clostridiales bacterium]
MALVSVIIPVYNVEAYLRRCVDSVLAQTHAQLEVILVDDGSPDNCGSICDAYAAADDRVRVIHKANGGLSSARNAGIEKAGGDYLAFIDSDDTVAPGMIAALLAALEREGADIAVCGFVKVGEDFRPLGKPNAFGPALLTGEEAMEKLYTNDYIYFTTVCNKLFRRSLFDKVCFPEGKLFEDGYVAFRCYLACGWICCLPDPLYYYLTRPDSITTSTVGVKNLDGVDADEDSMMLLENSAYPLLAQKARLKYFAAVTNNLRRFDLGEEAVRERFSTLHRAFRKHYRRLMREGAFSRKEKLLMTLFYLSPAVCKKVMEARKL